MNELLTRFKEYLVEKSLFRPSHKILLAVSGGIDSVVMCKLFKDANISFAIVHCNFSLRGAESDNDQKFVESLALTYGVKIFVKRFDTEAYAVKNKLSIQMAARDLRYAWFEQIRTKYNYKAVALAHHRDDVVETMLINLVRGTGVNGLHGILPTTKGGKIIRPLLFSSKDELFHYAKQQNLIWHDDSSNSEDTYVRNKLRHQVIPVLKKINPSLVDSLTQTADIFNEAGILIKQELEKRKKNVLSKKGNTFEVDLNKLKRQNTFNTLLLYLFTPFGFDASQLKEINKLILAQPGKRIQSTSHTIFRDRNKLIILPKTKAKFSPLKIKKGDRKVLLGHQELIFENNNAQNFKIIRDKNVACLDLKKLKFPLILRVWKAGDRFYPLGMNKSKKISDFLTDEKIPTHQKKQMLVLQSGREIAWVVGVRVSNTFKIDADSRQILVVHCYNC